MTTHRLALGLILALSAAPLAACGGDDDQAATTAAPPPAPAASTPADAPIAEVPPQPEVFGLGVGKQSLLGATPEAFAKVVGGKASGRGLLVTSVTQRGFFAGSSAADRVFFLQAKDDQFTATPNTRVDVDGRLRKAPSAPGKALGLNDRADITTVKVQGAYVRLSRVGPTPGS